MIDLIDNLSKVSTVPKVQLEELVEKLDLCIAHEATQIAETYDMNQQELDIGIGVLKLKYTQEGISYRFIPSKKLEKMIIQGIKSGNSPLTTLCENVLTDKILKTYKDLL